MRLTSCVIRQIYVRRKTKDATHIMRVTGGTAKGHTIRSPRGVDLRPMMEKVREALFNMLMAMGAIHGSVLDLYAGTGAVGIEALSRGFERADFVEKDYRAARAIEQNLETTGLAERGRIHRQRVEDVLEHPEVLGSDRPYDVISVTPPYEEVDFVHLTSVLAASSLVGPGTIVVVEYPDELGTMPETIGQLEQIRDRQYGRTRLAIYYVPETEQYDMDVGRGEHEG